MISSLLEKSYCISNLNHVGGGGSGVDVSLQPGVIDPTYMVYHSHGAPQAA